METYEYAPLECLSCQAWVVAGGGGGVPARVLMAAGSCVLDGCFAGQNG